MHHPPPTVVGALGLATTFALSHRMVAVALAWRRDAGTRANHIHLVDADRAVAYAQPGARGGIVTTTAMIDALSPAERRAVLAHEQAHLRHRHDRYLALAATIDIPPLWPFSDRLRAALERWADEEAAAATGDHTTVATAIARAALAAAPPPAPGLAATGGDIPRRVTALLAPRPTPARRYDIVALLLTLTIVTTTSTQLHHLIAVVETLCHR